MRNCEANQSPALEIYTVIIADCSQCCVHHVHDLLFTLSNGWLAVFTAVFLLLSVQGPVHRESQDN